MEKACKKAAVAIAIKGSIFLPYKPHFAVKPHFSVTVKLDYVALPTNLGAHIVLIKGWVANQRV